MSNHDGSYMLNEILKLLEEDGVFGKLGKEEAQEIVLKILKIGEHHDCNNGEILEDIGEKLLEVPPILASNAEGSCPALRAG